MEVKLEAIPKQLSKIPLAEDWDSKSGGAAKELKQTGHLEVEVKFILNSFGTLKQILKEHCTEQVNK